MCCQHLLRDSMVLRRKHSHRLSHIPELVRPVILLIAKLELEQLDTAGSRPEVALFTTVTRAAALCKSRGATAIDCRRA